VLCVWQTKLLPCDKWQLDDDNNNKNNSHGNINVSINDARCALCRKQNGAAAATCTCCRSKDSGLRKQDAGSKE